MAQNQEFWFAARTRANQELSLRKLLSELNIVHYLPTLVVTRRISDRIKKVEVPVIRNLIFIKTTKENAFTLVKERGLKLYYLKNRETSSLLIVPEKQMDNFKFAMDLSPEAAIHNNEEFTPGDKVRVVKGSLVGLEGELVRIDGKTHVLVRVPQVVAVGVKVSKGWLEKVE